MTRATNHRARTAPAVTLGLAITLSATLLAPATAAVADPLATCPAATLTETQLNHLIVDFNGATVTKGALGYRSTVLEYDDMDNSVWRRTVQTSDVANGRFGTVSTDSMGVFLDRSLANGFTYMLAKPIFPEWKAALAVLGRSSIWINRGRDENTAARTRPYELSLVTSGGTCTQDGSGLAVSFYEDGSSEYDYLTTVVTDSSLAVTSVATTRGEQRGETTTIAYGAFTVADIPAENRIAASSFYRTYESAQQRAAILSYGKKVAASAAAAAERADRPVRAGDVKAVKLTQPSGTTRTLVNTGVMVTATDKYTRKTLRLTVTVAQQKLTIGDNW